MEIPHDKGLDGHSDADVVLHALMDALLGAAALGDIGAHFPPADPRYTNISSVLLLKEVGRLLSTEGYAVINLDVTLVMERPKILPYVEAMRTTIAETLALSRDQISIKATTNEGLGFIGQGEGAAAHAVASIVRGR